jgi:malate dehydrogenase (oxaloacetate-decarboxylating)
MFPRLEHVREISYRVALAVGREAVRAGLTSTKSESLERAIENKMWAPQYVPLKRSA